MSKGDNKTTTNSSSSTTADPVAYQNYLNLINRATNVSNKPYEAFSGEETAGINDQQRAGFGTINAGVAGFDPSQVWSDIGRGAAPINADDINAYQDPYTNQVINATQADFDVQNQRANSVVTGNAASQNALGGNRVGVAQALTQEGQERVQAPQIANLRSQGFQSAVTNANAAKARSLQAGTSLAGANSSLMGANLAQGQAQVGAGTMEQQTQQTADTQKMSDYYRAQGYDFQTAQWLASILLPTGSQMGTQSTGQSTTEGPKPNTFMQLAGLGVSAAGAMSSTGGGIKGFADGGSPDGDSWVPEDRMPKGSPIQPGSFPTHAAPPQQQKQSGMPNPAGAMNAMSSLFGGGAEGAAAGEAGAAGEGAAAAGEAGAGAAAAGEAGAAAGFGEGLMDFLPFLLLLKDGGGVGARKNYASGGGPWDSGGSWVPNGTVRGSPIKGGEFAKHAQSPSAAQPDTAKMGASLGKIGRGLYDNYGAYDAANTDQNEGAGLSASDENPSMYAYGGGVRRGFADGGVPISTSFGGGFDDEDLSPNNAVNERFANPTLGSEQYQNMGEHSEALKAEGLLRRPADTVADDAPMTPRPVKTSSFLPPAAPGVAKNDIVPKAMEAFKNIRSGVAPQHALGYADEGDGEDGGGTSDATDFSAARRSAAVTPGVAAAAPPSSEKNIFGLPKLSDEARQGLISMGLSMMATHRGGKGSALGVLGEGGQQGMATYASAKAATAARDAQVRKEAFEREKFERPYKEMTADQRAKHNDGRYAIIPGVTTADGVPVERDTRHPGSPPINAITRKPLTPEEMSGVQTGGWKPFADKVTADEAADPVLINPQGQVKNARTGQLLGSDAKLQSAKEVVLSGSNVDTRAYQLALGDTKGAYAGLPFGSGGNRPKALVREQAVHKLMTDGGMSEKEAAEYLSSQSQAFTATGTGLSAEARTAGVREANLKIILKATDAAIPAALEASQAVSRTGWVPINRLIENGRVIASNPELKEFGMANLQLAEHWARAMNPTGVMRESDRDKALHFLSTTDSPTTYARAVAQLKKQIDRELGAVQSVKAHGGFGAKVSEKDSTADAARKELETGAGGSPPPARAAAPPAQKTVTRTGKINSGPDAGKTVTEYSDGTREVK